MVLQSLRTKLTLAFAVLGLGPLVIMGLVASMFITNTHRKDVAELETQLLRQKVSEINKFMESVSGLFDIRVSYEYTSVINDDDQQFLLDKLLEENQFIWEASFTDLNGRETKKVSKIQDATRVELSDISQLEKFTKARAGAKYFSPVHYAKAGPYLTISSPVYNSKDQIIMILSGEVSLDPLTSSFAAARLGNEGYLYLVDRSGTVVAGRSVGTNYGSNTWISDLLKGLVHDGLGDSDQRPGVVGKEVFSAGLALPKFNWGVVAEWPVDDAFAIVSTVQRQVAAFSMTTIILVALLGAFMGKKILRPLFELKQGAKMIGSGNFDHKIEIKTGDEIEELGSVFNTMASDLKKLEELRAAQIKAEALAESLRKELELSRMREEFLSNTSHQLRTPMSIANWNFDLVANAKTEDDRKEALSELDTGLRQLNAIITDLMVVGEYGVGFKNKVHKEIKLAELMAKVEESRKKYLDEKQLKLVTDIKNDLPAFFAHPFGLQIILENLLDNAITYSKPGSMINISVAAGDANLKFTVSDTGIGILEKDKSSIFTQFFRGENAIVMKNVGTGLGLLICKNIVEGHDGKIWFESKENEGTKFYFTIPQGQPDPIPAKVPPK